MRVTNGKRIYKGLKWRREKGSWTHDVEGESCKDVFVDFKGMRVFSAQNQLGWWGKREVWVEVVNCKHTKGDRVKKENGGCPESTPASTTLTHSLSYTMKRLKTKAPRAAYAVCATWEGKMAVQMPKRMSTRRRTNMEEDMAVKSIFVWKAKRVRPAVTTAVVTTALTTMSGLYVDAITPTSRL